MKPIASVSHVVRQDIDETRVTLRPLRSCHIGLVPVRVKRIHRQMRERGKLRTPGIQAPEGCRGHRGLAARSRPRAVRTGFSRKRDRRRDPARSDGGGPRKTRRAAPASQADAQVGRLDSNSAELQARVGIAAGLVVVGDLIGEGSAQEQSVVGETPNLAARLQARAGPDAVVIAAGPRRLVGDLFEYRDLGAVEVKGIAGPVPAWQVLRPSAAASRFEALRGSALSRLIGRDEEIDLLLRRWARAKAGDGQVVLISRGTR